MSEVSDAIKEMDKTLFQKMEDLPSAEQMRDLIEMHRSVSEAIVKELSWICSVLMKIEENLEKITNK